MLSQRIVAAARSRQAQTGERHRRRRRDIFAVERCRSRTGDADRVHRVRFAVSAIGSKTCSGSRQQRSRTRHRRRRRTVIYLVRTRQPTHRQRLRRNICGGCRSTAQRQRVTTRLAAAKSARRRDVDCFTGANVSVVECEHWIEGDHIPRLHSEQRERIDENRCCVSSVINLVVGSKRASDGEGLSPDRQCACVVGQEVAESFCSAARCQRV